MTPEEHLEARAEQLVEAMRRERKRHEFRVINSTCFCNTGWVATEEGARGAYIEWQRHVESAVLNVVRTEREQVTCGECRGRGEVVAGRGRTHDPVFAKCSAGCIDGSVPGELLVVGLIGSEG